MSLDEFKETFCRRLQHPNVVHSAGYEPVWFLVYDPKRTIEMISFRESLAKHLEIQGMEPISFDVSEALWSILEADADWSFIKEADEEALDRDELLRTLQGCIESNHHNFLVERLKETLQLAGQKTNSVLLVSGFEAIHGFMRPGSLEAKLNGCFICPTVFFYPGKTEGKAGLQFLNFYPVDGNYHSEHLVVPEA